MITPHHHPTQNKSDHTANVTERAHNNSSASYINSANLSYRQGLAQPEKTTKGTPYSKTLNPEDHNLLRQKEQQLFATKGV